jgi:hypothetical protein
MRRTIALSAVAALTAGLGLIAAGPASASSNVTFSVSAGTLSISEPDTSGGPMNLGTATSSAVGTTVQGAVGSTTITDNRGSLAGWTVKIGSTDFSDSATPADVIAASKASAWAPATGTGAPTVTSGIAVVTNTHISAATGLTLANTPASFMTATTTGSNVVTYNPNLTITIGSSVVSGTYNGTVTQTVT